MGVRKRRWKNKKRTGLLFPYVFVVAFVIFSGLAGFSVYHFVNANVELEPVYVELDPNLGVQAFVEEFFNANDAPEMIPIIKCESQFRHYNADGTILQNRAGSSAIGVAQILSSAHPDPNLVSRFNKRHNTNLTLEDLDLTTVEGNVGYALVLYEMRGTRDWECAKKFRFST